MKPGIGRVRLAGRTRLLFVLLRIYVLLTVPIAAYALIKALL